MSTRPSLKDMTNAALSAMQAGQNAQALQLSCTAMLDSKAGHVQRLVFARAFERTTIPSLIPQLKKALELSLDHADVESQRFFAGWYHIFKNFPLFAGFWKEDAPDWDAIQPALQDKFLLEGLQNLNFTDWELERVFTRFRHDLLLVQFPKGALKTKHLPVLCALAEHCFQNEYVFSQTAEEIKAIENIEPNDPISLALTRCYKPLANMVFDEKMSAVAAFRHMIKVQVGYTRRENEIMKGFDSSSSISASTSKDVQEMYEENPYPRWSSVNMPHIHVDDIRIDVLLAGCGTGRTGIPFAAAFPESNFTAIDLSRRSVAYATRMAETYGIDNLSFIHLDILDAGNLGRKFDYIESSGVLHHMEYPEKGWASLVSCLKEGGGMQIALYSAKTRENIDFVRNSIKSQGYQSTPDDIRRVRVDIAGLPSDNPLTEVMRTRDFYSMSPIRDLVFHIQETAYTIPELEKMMERLELEFDGFKSNPVIQAAYRARFPDDPAMTSFANWNVFEHENPQTFIGMYRIFCHKKGQIVSDDVKRIRQMQA